MQNDTIGQLAGKLNALDDAGRENTPEYAAIKVRYDALKALPENWSDVRRAKRTPAQQDAARAWALENGSDPETV
jgi:hypothetical protein